MASPMPAAATSDELQGRVFDPRLFRRLLGYARPHATGFIVSLVLLILLAFLTLLAPLVIGKTVDLYMLQKSPVQGLKNPLSQGVGSLLAKLGAPLGENLGAQARKQGFLVAALLLAILGGLVFLFRFLQMLIINRTGQQVIHDLRQEVFQHITYRNLRFFDSHPVGALVTRVTGDIETLNEFFTSGVDVLVSDLLRVTAIAVLLFLIDLRMALATLMVVPLLLAWAFYFQRRARKLFRRVRGRVTRLNSFMNEFLSGIQVLKLFRRERALGTAFDRVNQDLKEAHVATVWNFSWFFPGMEFLSTAGNAAILMVGASLVAKGSLRVGDLYVCTLLLSLFIEPLRQLADKYNILQAAVAAGERVFHVLDDASAISCPARPRPLDDLKGEVTFEQVHFSYASNKPVLKGVSFQAAPGERLAIVGATGAGKTTIINLLARFYDPDQGRILLDGVDLARFNPRELRRKIGIVLQDVFLFAGSVRENLTLGDASLSDAWLMEAARTVRAEQLIHDLGGLDAALGERAATLSSGEKQLLAFARTLAHRPAILVLDEATAHIDSISEALIQQGLAALSSNRTALIIAHRLSTIENSDRILVLHHGELREEGRHEELLRQGGIYARLYRMQFAAGPAAD